MAILLPPLLVYQIKGVALGFACEGLHSTEVFHRETIHLVTSSAVYLRNADLPPAASAMLMNILVASVQWGDHIGSKLLAFFIVVVEWCLS